MNTTISRALFLDILYQTLDNRMFRLLVLLVLGLVAPTFLIAFREDSIELLFGWRKISYASLYQTFDAGSAGEHAPAEVIGFLQAVFVEFFAGMLGLLFCIAATAFFLPLALEKGAAENVFVKPVSRLTILLTRYAAGLFFVAVLATLLVAGMHLGLLLVSGYSDPGFLWSAVTLVYLFAILHSVSIALGVFTRSAVTALLGTMMFFALNGCIQKVWTMSISSHELEEVQESWTRNPTPADESASEKESEEASPLPLFMKVLTAAHYVLPKTMDAGFISRKLRKSLESGAPYEDPVTKLRVAALPEGMSRVGGGEVTGEGIVWTTDEGARLTLRRFPRKVEREGKRPRFLFASSAASDRSESLEESAGLLSDVETLDLQLSGGGRTSSLVWEEKDAAGTERHKEAHYFPGDGDWLHVIEVDAPAGLLGRPDADGSLVRDFLSEIEPPGETEPISWYERQLGWDAPLRFNLWFSIGSTLAFVLFLLGLAWWKLARMDF